MLLQINEKLEDLIVFILAERKSASANWLQANISKNYRKCSLTAVYKELNKLQRLGIVLKIHNQFCLSHRWVIKFVNLADKMYDTHMVNPPFDTLVPENGSKVEWTINCLYKLDEFCAHIVVSLLQHCQNQHMYEWAPHSWAVLLNPEKEEHFQEALNLTDKVIYHVIGGESYLDRLRKKQRSSKQYQISLNPSLFQGQRTTYFNVIGNYILSMKHSTKFAEALDQFYQDVETKEDLDLGKFLAIANNRNKIAVTLERSPSKAQELSTHFIEHGELS